MAARGFHNSFFRSSIEQSQTNGYSTSLSLESIDPSNEETSSATPNSNHSCIDAHVASTIGSSKSSSFPTTCEHPRSSSCVSAIAGTSPEHSGLPDQDIFGVDGLLCYYQNLGGMNSSLSDYRLACSDAAYDVYAFTETWLTENTLSHQIFGNEYSVFRTDRSQQTSSKNSGGGVLLAVRSNIKCKALQPPNGSTIEQLWVELKSSVYTLFICVLYIPPDRINDPSILIHCSDSLSWITSRIALTDKILILGDFNFSSVAWCYSSSGYLYPNLSRSSLNPLQKQLLDDFSTAGLVQINTVLNSNHRLLDLCFVTADQTFDVSITEAPTPLVKHVRHHPALHISIKNFSLCKFNPINENIRYKFWKTDFQSMNRFLCSIDWNSLFFDLNTDTTVEVFSFILLYAIDQFTPKAVSKPPLNPPWSNHSLKKLKSLKRSALRKYTKYRDSSSKSYYCSCNTRYKHLNKKLFRGYLRRTQSSLRRNPKKFWSYINDQRKESGLPSTMHLSDNQASTLPDICELFRQQFSAVFTNENLDVHQVNEAASNVPQRPSVGPHPTITDATVQSACTKLKSSSNPGPDGIPAIILKNAAIHLLYH